MFVNIFQGSFSQQVEFVKLKISLNKITKSFQTIFNYLMKLRDVLDKKAQNHFLLLSCWHIRR